VIFITGSTIKLIDLYKLSLITYIGYVSKGVAGGGGVVRSPLGAMLKGGKLGGKINILN
jgi:hypothetical protein